MANWLDKNVNRAVTAAKKQTLPTAMRVKPPAAPQGRREPQKLPNAAIVYGVAASILGLVALYFLFTGRWFTGVLVLFLAACFLGFALHFIKHAP